MYLVPRGFLPQPAAYPYVLNSLDQVACVAERAALPHETQQPEDLSCPLCDSQLEYLQSLLDHLAHFDFAPLLSLPPSRAMASLAQPSWTLALSTIGDDAEQKNIGARCKGGIVELAKGLASLSKENVEV